MKPAMLNYSMKPAMLDFAIELSTILGSASHYDGLCQPPCWTVPATMMDFASLSSDFTIPVLDSASYCTLPALLDSALKQALLASQASATGGYQAYIK